MKTIPLETTRLVDLGPDTEFLLLRPDVVVRHGMVTASGIKATAQQIAEALAPMVRHAAIPIQIGKMELRPGEILIIQSAQPLSLEQLEHLRASLHRLLPGQPVFVLLPGFHLYGVQPAEDGLRALAQQLRPFLTEPTGASGT